MSFVLPEPLRDLERPDFGHEYDISLPGWRHSSDAEAQYRKTSIEKSVPGVWCREAVIIWQQQEFHDGRSSIVGPEREIFRACHASDPTRRTSNKTPDTPPTPPRSLSPTNSRTVRFYKNHFYRNRIDPLTSLRAGGGRL